MVTQQLTTYRLEYPDGWQETWTVQKGATRESKMALAFQLLEEAGVEVKVLLSDPEGRTVPQPSDNSDQADVESDQDPDAEASDEIEKQEPPSADADDTAS